MDKFALIKKQTEKLNAVELPENIRPIEIKFALNVLQGYSFPESYRLAMGARASKMTSVQLSRAAYKLRRRKAVQKYQAALRQELERVAIANSLDIQVFLTAVMETPIGHIDEFSPLCQKKKTTITTIRHKDGSETETKKIDIEMPNKHACAQTLMRMQGLDAPIKVEHNHRVGVMVVPMASSLEEWEKIAATSQQQLMEDALLID